MGTARAGRWDTLSHTERGTSPRSLSRELHSETRDGNQAGRSVVRRRNDAWVIVPIAGGTRTSGVGPPSESRATAAAQPIKMFDLVSLCTG
jgi:hypothetical protein